IGELEREVWATNKGQWSCGEVLEQRGTRVIGLAGNWCAAAECIFRTRYIRIGPGYVLSAVVGKGDKSSLTRAEIHLNRRVRIVIGIELTHESGFGAQVLAVEDVNVNRVPIDGDVGIDDRVAERIDDSRIVVRICHTPLVEWRWVVRQI